jgi:hypothetical protein
MPCSGLFPLGFTSQRDGSRGWRSKLAVCNFQDTPVDGLADIRIYADTDILMTQVMENLSYPIPPFILRRRLTVAVELASPGRQQLVIRGLDVSSGTPSKFLTSVQVAEPRLSAVSDRFVIGLQEFLQPGQSVQMELEFMGHYGEPALQLVHVHDGIAAQTKFLLKYNPRTREWKTER